MSVTLADVVAELRAVDDVVTELRALRHSVDRAALATLVSNSSQLAHRLESELRAIVEPTPVPPGANRETIQALRREDARGGAR